MTKHYLLNHIRLESGFIRHNGGIQSTECREYTLEIDGDKIVAIHEGDLHSAGIPSEDGQGRLLLPSTRDEHIHLDKTFYGDPWRAARENNAEDIFQMIALEETLLPTLLPGAQQRTHRLLQLLQEKGTTHVRTHCNIEPTSGLQSLLQLQEALMPWRSRIHCEIVAFPQHGLLRSNAVVLMKEAMALGCDWVGGLDPSKVDGDMARSLDMTLNLALDAGKGIDYHLHEDKSTGIACIRYLLNALREEPSLQNKLTLSHAYCLAQIETEELNELADEMVELGVSLATGIPLGTSVMPLPFLQQKGVSLLSGTDSVTDHWSPFGSGSMLDKAYDWARLYTRGSEFEVSRSLAIATGNRLPLNNKGERIWPLAGDEASFILIDASCSAEVVARQVAVDAVYFCGKKVWNRQ
jgi:cytosine/adenosine deaminase-related metal-dependent hydrolase